MQLIFVERKSSNQIYNQLIQIKYIVNIEFSEKGIKYCLMQKANNDRVSISFYNLNAKKERIKCQEKLHKKFDIEPFRTEMLKSEEDVRIPSRDIYHLIEKLAYGKKMYLNEEMRFRYDPIMKDLRYNLKISDNSKNIFILLTVLLLDIPDQIFDGQKKEIPVAIYILEMLFLQYFHIGEEEFLEVKYDELLEFFNLDKHKN